jgi:predicted AAA+ superfamily ATPase
LSAQADAPLRYWSMTNPSYEVDFVLQYKNRIMPIEVKSDENVKSGGLKKFRELYGGKIDLNVRFSLKNLLLQDGILNIPLYLADNSLRLIDIALALYT